MTQELRQSIMMLQYNAQELTEFLQEQMLENPLIELGGFHKGTVDNQMDIYREKPVTLWQHLQSQLREMVLPKDMQRLVMLLIDCLTESGYIEDTEDELAGILQASLPDVKQSILILQTMEPAGVGARSLQECLSLQLKRLHRRDELAEQLVSSHFEDLARRDWKRLLQLLHINASQLQEALDTIVALQPKPGLAFSHDISPYITPDIKVIKHTDTYVVELQRKYIPKIRIHPDYRNLLDNHSEQEVTTYLSEKYHQVNWILRSMEQRDRTLVEVMQAIIRRQEDFFRKGPLHIKPLSLKEIADELHIHESTVSRATRHKYVDTSYGLYEMKFFFSHALPSSEQEGVSAKRVKELLKRLVDEENKNKPYSDQKLVVLLEGRYRISISRRTVAKYREQCNVPCATKRKRIGT